MQGWENQTVWMMKNPRKTQVLGSANGGYKGASSPRTTGLHDQWQVLCVLGTSCDSCDQQNIRPNMNYAQGGSGISSLHVRRSINMQKERYPSWNEHAANLEDHGCTKMRCAEMKIAKAPLRPRPTHSFPKQHSGIKKELHATADEDPSAD